MHKLFKWPIGEKRRIRIVGLKDHESEEPLEDAVATGELRTEAGDVVAGSEFDFDPIGGGDYVGTLPALELMEGTRYDLFVLDPDADEPVRRRLEGEAVYRGTN